MSQSTQPSLCEMTRDEGTIQARGCEGLRRKRLSITNWYCFNICPEYSKQLFKPHIVESYEALEVCPYRILSDSLEPLRFEILAAED